MKKSIFYISALLFAGFLFADASAQQALNDVAISKPPATGKFARVLNSKADKNFKKSFRMIYHETWNEKPDGYRAKFNDKGIRYMVDYNKKGKWVSTIKSYDPSRLSNEISKAVQTANLGYSVIWAVEITTGKVTVYLVKIGDEKELKTIRVINGEMDVIEEYRKG